MNNRQTVKHTVNTRPSRALRVLAPCMAANLLALAVNSAYAQDDADGARVLEEVLVTAQKREQLSQRVPVSLFAISGDSLADAGVTNIDQLEQVAAGVTISAASPDQLNVSMRGVSNLSSNFLAGPASGVYIDETPISAFSSAIPQLALGDAERVEVLRGPQGTLFGEGSMGGTIRIITNKPDASGFSARLQAGYEDVSDGDSGYKVNGMLNVPIVEDTLALRINASYDDIIGWVDVPDLDEKDTNEGDQQNIRVALRWTPSEKLTADFAYENLELDIDNDFFATSPGIYQPSELNPAYGPVRLLSPRKTEYDLYSLTVNYDMGFASLVGTVSYFESEFTSVGDRSYVLPVFFGLPGIGRAPFNTEVEVDTQELRLVSNGENRLDWTIGAYRKNDDRNNPDSGFQFFIPDLEPIIGTAVDEALNTVTSENEAYAVFGDVEFELFDDFYLQAGARYYSADYEQLTRFETTSLLLGTVEGEVEGEGDSDETSLKFGASWNISDYTMVYARYSEGFRDGGVNANAQPSRPEIPSDFDPEIIEAFEIGIKSQPTEWLQVNGSVYQNEWTDLQLGFVTSDGLLGFTDNAGEAEATGAELEILARPISGLTLGLNLAYLDATIEEQVVNAFGFVLAEEGNTIPFSPEYQASLSASYLFPLTGDLQGIVTGNYAYRDETFSTAENFESEVNESYNLVYLSAGLVAESWNANLYVSNALDEDGTNIRGRFVTALPEAFGGYLQPRTIGAQVTFLF